MLWISRHEPLPAQVKELKEKLGDFELIRHEQPLPTAQHAVSLIEEKKADVVVAVLPLTFMMHLAAELAKRNITLLRADMEAIHNCSSSPCPEFNPNTDTIMVSKDNDREIHRHFRFRGFKVLREVRLVEEDWIEKKKYFPELARAFSIPE